MTVTLAMKDAERADEPNVVPITLSLAIALHLAIATLPARRASTPATPPPLEVELATPRLPPSPPAPPPEPPKATDALRAPRPAPRAPAAAGKLVASNGPASEHDAPLDFVSDPNGAGYGFGVVSRTGVGRAEGALAASARSAAPALPTPAPPPALAAAEDLSEKPHVLAEDPCRGYYPASASVDAASAVVRVVLDAGGRVESVALVSETPRGEGFGGAATACFRAQRFSPALDRNGRRVATATTIRVRFER